MAPTAIYTLSLHDALPIWSWALAPVTGKIGHLHRLDLERLGDLDCNRDVVIRRVLVVEEGQHLQRSEGDRKSTRLNSSHQIISYAVFCLKKQNGLALRGIC